MSFLKEGEAVPPTELSARKKSSSGKRAKNCTVGCNQITATRKREKQKQKYDRSLSQETVGNPLPA